MCDQFFKVIPFCVRSPRWRIMKCKGVGSLIQTLRGVCQALEEDASWCEEEERVLGVRMPWGAP